MSYAPNHSDFAVSNRTYRRTDTPALKSKSLKRNGRSAVRRGRSNPSRIADAASNYPIIVHSHLCWDWVWQRPQQFISRLSQRHPILFVETHAPDPSLVAPLVRHETLVDYPNITLLRLQFPCWRWGDAAYVDAMRCELVKEALSGPLAGRFQNPVQWFYDPMAVPAFTGQLDEIATVYDCMDELSKFRAAPPSLVGREALLLKRADVVFTGGRKLYESKKRHNDNCHFYGCGVDVSHFGRAQAEDTVIPKDLQAIPGPVLGYFGVVDERLDYDLIARLADANPKWSIVIIGPTTKVDPQHLPRRSNLHWFGGRPYSELPSYCKGFDLCLMPFALNESTEFINPTKALEYMAAGRPIISSAVPDVVSNFKPIARVASSHDEFIKLCIETLSQPDHDLTARGLRMAAENTWESIVAKLENHIENVLTKKQSALITA